MDYQQHFVNWAFCIALPATSCMNTVCWLYEGWCEPLKNCEKSVGKKSFCVENHKPILLSETTFSLTGFLLPADGFNRPNISKPFSCRKRHGEWMTMTSSPGAQTFSFISFLFTFFSVCFCQQECWETPSTQFSGRGGGAGGQRSMSTAGPVETRPLTRPFKDRLPSMSESRGLEGRRVCVCAGGRNRKAND